jgi:hypothetical protein
MGSEVVSSYKKLCQHLIEVVLCESKGVEGNIWTQESGCRRWLGEDWIVGKMRRTMHVAREGKERNTYRILAGNPEGWRLAFMGAG